MSNKAWGGRFSEQPEAWVDEFNASIHFDKALIEYDVQGSIAHATMLANQGIISNSDCEQIKQGLNDILADYKQNKLDLDVSLEDIHLNIEHELIKRIGDAGGRLHTGRSRNDQIATDMHLYTKSEVTELIALIESFQATIVSVAEDNVDTIMPGYTHLQRAQPISFAHHILTYY